MALDFMMNKDLEITLLEINLRFNQDERFERRRNFLRELHKNNIDLMFSIIR
jgi:hypothetical protein